MIVSTDSEGPEAAGRATVCGGGDGRCAVTLKSRPEEPQHRGPLARRDSQIIDGRNQAVVGCLVYSRPRGREVARQPFSEAAGQGTPIAPVHPAKGLCCSTLRHIETSDVNATKVTSLVRNEDDCSIASIY